MIFTCTSCYATWFSLALSWSSLALHATLLDFHLHFHWWGGVGCVSSDSHTNVVLLRWLIYIIRPGGVHVYTLTTWKTNTNISCLYSLIGIILKLFLGYSGPPLQARMLKMDLLPLIFVLALRTAHVSKNPNGKSSCLLTGGAPCYPKVAKECRAKHFFVINHSAGEFQRTERFRNRALSVLTGTIDSCWKQMKTYIPKSLSSQSKQIPLRIRSWQWRFTHAEHDNLFQLCGTQVAKL